MIEQDLMNSFIPTHIIETRDKTTSHNKISSQNNSQALSLWGLHLFNKT